MAAFAYLIGVNLAAEGTEAPEHIVLNMKILIFDIVSDLVFRILFPFIYYPLHALR